MEAVERSSCPTSLAIGAAALWRELLAISLLWSRMMLALKLP